MLDDAWDHSQQTAHTLREELRANETAVGNLLSQGQLASVSKNSASQSYAFSGQGTLTTADIARGWRDLINLFDRCFNLLTAAGSATTDEDVLAEMRARLSPVYQTRADISGLRVCA